MKLILTAAFLLAVTMAAGVLGWHWYVAETFMLCMVMLAGLWLPSVAKWFFLLTSAHTLFGFWPAMLASDVSLPSANNAFYSLPEVFSVYSMGVVLAFLSYLTFTRTNPTITSRIADRLRSFDPRSAGKRTAILTLVGMALIGVYIYKAGFVEMFLTGIFDRRPAGLEGYDALARRGFALLVVCVPMGLFEFRGKWRLVPVLAFVLMILTTRRGPFVLASAIVIFVCLIQKKHITLIKVSAICLISAVFVLQYFFIMPSVPKSVGAVDQVLFLAQSLSGEAKETAWVYSQWNHHPYLGKTYIAGILPIPVSSSSFKSSYSISNLTLDLAGVDRDAGSGGIRMTAWGEAYMNFFYVGVIVISFCLSRLLRHADLLLERCRDLPSGALVPVVFLIMFGIFLSYASGSVVLSDGLLSAFALWWITGSKRATLGASGFVPRNMRLPGRTEWRSEPA